MAKPNLLFLVPYPQGKAPSQRFRFEQYFEALRQEEIPYQVQSFINEQTWAVLYKPGHHLQKVLGILRGFLRRWFIFFKLHRYDYVFIHREAAPLGPPLFEWLIARVWRRKVVFDFDDAIWLPNTSAANRLVAGLKWHQKTLSICKWSYRVSAGNAYLADYARQVNQEVVVNPTTIDMVGLHNQPQEQRTAKPALGWTGSHSTLHYLDALEPVLQDLEQDYDFEFVVIADVPPQLQLRSLRFVKWQKETEKEDLLRFHIGLMPLQDDAWSRGKCGFKALQYMSLGIPAVVSPVGVNASIVDDGVNGYLCAGASSWKQAIETLLSSEEARVKMGQAARAKIAGHFSVEANTPRFLRLFA